MSSHPPDFSSIPEIIAHIEGKFADSIWVGREYSIADLCDDLRAIEANAKKPGWFSNLIKPRGSLIYTIRKGG